MFCMIAKRKLKGACQLKVPAPSSSLKYNEKTYTCPDSKDGGKVFAFVQTVFVTFANLQNETCRALFCGQKNRGRRNGRGGDRLLINDARVIP
jgi:hypothetical protein